MAKAPFASPLTPRERAVLQQVATGRSNKEIARLLDISPETVKSNAGHRPLRGERPRDFA
jgi:DNA-binding CsgD family transcriptional regulator